MNPRGSEDQISQEKGEKWVKKGSTMTYRSIVNPFLKIFLIKIDWIYLPPFRNFNKETLKEYLKGNRDFLRLDSVKFVGKVRDFPELAMPKLLDLVNQDQSGEILKFLPKIDLSTLDKTYLMNVVSIFFKLIKKID